MSSSQESSAPYKSRLLNFFNRQYLKINSSLGISVRQFTQTFNTGIATILYPFYLLLNNTKKLGNIFTQKSSQVEQQKLNQSTQKISSDYILDQVSEQIINISEIPKLKKNSAKGMASLINNQQIIIAKNNNQIKTFFSPRQQEKIKIIINDIVTEYEKQNKFLLKGELREKKYLQGSFNIIKSFNQKKYQQRINHNLEKSKKSEIIKNSQHLSEQLTDEAKNSISDKIILFIDRVVFKIEKGTLIIFEGKNKNITNPKNDHYNADLEAEDKKYFRILIESAIKYFFGSKKEHHQTIDDSNYEQKIIDSAPGNQKNAHNIIHKNREISKAIENIAHQTQEVLPIIQAKTEKLMVKGLSQASLIKTKVDNLIQDDNPLNIQALIWAAIDYFFNVKLDENKPLTFSKNSEELFLIDGQISDPWLSWEDLYGEKKSPLFNNQLKTNPPSAIVIDKSLEKDLEISKQVSDNKNNLTNQSLSKNKNNTENKTITIVQEKEFTEVEKHPSEGEIEAKVISIGYDKHFLEIILEKLDTLILALEEFILKIIRFLKSLIA
ncbi:hypothetical protein IQ215_12535 [Cyanobacterium stanieri LEGE 03274]|uniref:Uncharacterized protein n=1 Tax=Cyanobacterium stanieri LEGE 03274 TaxID=1828756 RepID=A0ABR9V6J2_9CHRO|nr:hypothetical protein [Cyanobacterium stanieri]MBE9223523.1 hypothetical protein [Cyanobacterium stanieri LEGE 03274]